MRPEKRAEIQQALSLLYEKHLNTTLLDEKVLLSPPQISLEGDYQLAEITYADETKGIFGLRGITRLRN